MPSTLTSICVMRATTAAKAVVGLLPSSLTAEEEATPEDSAPVNSDEVELKEFKESNRRVERSPSLRLQESRLEREVSLQTTLYMSLKSQFENVKIEEVEESAMIEVIDGPIVPFKLTRPKKTLTVIREMQLILHSQKTL